MFYFCKFCPLIFGIGKLKSYDIYREIARLATFLVISTEIYIDIGQDGINKKYKNIF